MARLLVSVRSAEEARLAVVGGASIIDVKEPANGSLGRASAATWREVRRALPDDVEVSAALGELSEWSGDGPQDAVPDALAGFNYLKVGLAGSGPRWDREWRSLAERLTPPGARWIAVIYSDWETAGAPSPAMIADAELPVRGVLLDTRDKSGPAVWNRELIEVADRFRERGAMLALAGGLTPERMDEIARLRPDVVAVRGAACEGGDRVRGIDPERVASLVSLVRSIPVG